MKLNQLFSPVLLLIAVVLIAGWVGVGQQFLSAGNAPGHQSPQTNLLLDNDKKESLNRESDKVGGGAGPAKDEVGNEATRKLLQKSITLLRSKSFQSPVRQRGMLFGIEVIAEGQYLQADGGKGGVKAEMQIQTQHLDLQVRMVNDGVYFFRQVHDANESIDLNATDKGQAKIGGLKGQANSNSIQDPKKTMVERINLRQIREKLNGKEFWSGYWIAYGGLYSFLDQARRCFDFGGLEDVEVNQKKYWKINGTWKPEKLARLVPDQKDSILRLRTINWERIPQQIPLEIEIYFYQSGELSGFPFRIIFYRPREELLDGVQSRPILVTEFSNPKIVDTPTQADFQFNAAENEVDDVTERFLNSILN